MKKSKFQQGYERGYDEGILSIISKLYIELEDLKNSKKILDKLNNWINKNYEEYIPVFGYDEPTAYEKKFCFVKTYTYRGIDVDIFCDDYGQCYYFYYNNKSHSCGTYNPDYESCVECEIDHDLDDIVNFAPKGFYGGICKYSNHEHTKVDFIFRGELIDTYDIDKDDPESVVKIWKDCEKRLEKLYQNSEFLEMEEKRKQSGNLYIGELIAQEESKTKNE